MSRKVIWVIVAIVVVLGAGGSLAERALSAAGLNPKPPAKPSDIRGVTRNPSESALGPQMHSSLVSFMGLVRLRPFTAPPISLVDQRGVHLSLRALRGRVVVLTFFDATCNDICPVVGRELRLAERDLGPMAKDVTFLTVNTDPLYPAPYQAGAALRGTSLSDLSNWHFLNGSLRSLQRVWKSYGISIDVAEQSGRESHNDVLYEINRRGEVVMRATPFADETPAGSFTLPGPEKERFAGGLAKTVRSILAAGNRR